ncbi:hypothetical protein IQ218_03445 [Synechocystis salina LEGE 06099]|uniref:hypothetical protein n=1 Tax=Synechocystis salina TaxID=945780 RepID=UPI00187FB376|nr:hypothetical protein [Synechocystis salina]MBE9202694.1 hypothetical protein [Synechocystis salina LEGE 06099]
MKKQFPVARTYNPERMDKEFALVREAHERNNEILRWSSLQGQHRSPRKAV